MKGGKFILSFFILCFTSNNGFTQNIMGGPVVGAVTDTSARILVVFDKPETGSLTVKENNTAVYFSAFMNTEDLPLEKISVFSISNLHPNTTYHYFIKLNDKTDTIAGTFKTFPKQKTVSNFTFTFGSCTENYRDDTVFIEMQKQHPDFFLHLGDWTYPDHAGYPEKPLNNNHRFFIADPNEIYKSYLIRYSLPHLQQLLKTTSVDYVFDDEDGIWDDFSKHSYCDIQLQNGQTIVKDVSFPDSLREHLLTSYHQYFPGYINPAHPQEAYHSFVYGNTEIFFIETRSTRSPNCEVFYQTKKGKWKFKTPASHEILDSTQLNWLLNGLKNSTADWKIIISGTSFNADYKKVLDICMLNAVQNRKLPNGMSGIYVAAAMSAMWFAFPATQHKLISFCRNNHIENVFICSGDAHTSAIDNGKHSGFPEIMSANLMQENTRFAAIVQNNLRMKLWNQGGQGINNHNYNDAFGKVQVFGRDSVRLSAIDKYGTEICSYILKPGFIPARYNLRKHSKVTAGNKLRAFKNLLKVGVHLRQKEQQ